MSDDKTVGQIQPAAAFQALPLNHMIAEPLKAAVQAQQSSAIALENYIRSFIDENGKPITIDFKSRIKDTDGTDRTVSISAPLLSIVPIPHLSINEINTHFSFEVSHVRKEASRNDGKLEGNVASQGIVSKFVDLSLSGNVSTTSESQQTSNQSGKLDISVKASQAPVPAGLQKIMDIMAQSIVTE